MPFSIPGEQVAFKVTYGAASDLSFIMSSGLRSKGNTLTRTSKYSGGGREEELQQPNA